MTRNERWRKMSVLGSIAMAKQAMHNLANDKNYSLAVQLRAHSIYGLLRQLDELARKDCRVQTVEQHMTRKDKR